MEKTEQPDPTARSEAANYVPRWGKITGWLELAPATTTIVMTEDTEDTETLRVVRVGPGEYMESGDQIPAPAKPGDLIVVAKHAGIDVRLGMQAVLRIVGHADVLAVIAGA